MGAAPLIGTVVRVRGGHLEYEAFDADGVYESLRNVCLRFEWRCVEQVFGIVLKTTLENSIPSAYQYSIANSELL